MSGWASAQLRRAAVAAVAFAFAPEARPQDSNPASPNEARAQPDAIAGAKKDFQSIKSVRDEALLPKSGLPRVSLPELPARSPSPGVVTNPTTPPREAKPGNWLVEAMEKPDTLRNPRGADARSRDRGGKSESAEGISDAEKGERRHFAGDRQEGGSEQLSTAVVINPLARYLNDWMTPQDYALLRPGLTDSFDPRVDAKTSAPFSAPGLSLTMGGLNDFAFGGQPPGQPTNAASLRRENPYLETLKRESIPGPNAGTARTLGSPPMPTPSMPATIAPPPRRAPTPTKIPEFAQPSIDDKYFKQLKRF